MRKKIGFLILVAVFVLFLVYFFSNTEKFKLLLHVDLYLLFLIVVGDVFLIFMNGVFTKLILQPFDKSIPLVESFFVSLISSVGNFFAPVGAGFGFRAIYLKKKFGLPYSEYISTLSGNYVLVFLINSFFGLVALYLLRDRHDSRYSVLLITFSGLFLFSLMMSLIKIPMRDVKLQRNNYVKVFMRNLATVTQGWNNIISRKRLMLRLAGLTTINLMITMLITLTIIKSLQLSISFAPLLLFSVLGSLSLFVNITPANLGVKEAIYLFSSSILGFSAVQILSIALIDRGVMFVVLAILWLLSPKIRSPNKAIELAE